MANRNWRQLTAHVQAHGFTCDAIDMSVQIQEPRLRMPTAAHCCRCIRSALQDAALFSLAQSATITRSPVEVLHTKMSNTSSICAQLYEFDVATSQVLCSTSKLPFTHLIIPCSLTPALCQISLQSKLQSPFVQSPSSFAMIDYHASQTKCSSNLTFAASLLSNANARSETPRTILTRQSLHIPLLQDSEPPRPHPTIHLYSDQPAPTR
jgi:hypothetical protein